MMISAPTMADLFSPFGSVAALAATVPTSLVAAKRAAISSGQTNVAAAPTILGLAPKTAIGVGLGAVALVGLVVLLRRRGS